MSKSRAVFVICKIIKSKRNKRLSVGEWIIAKFEWKWKQPIDLIMHEKLHHEFCSMNKSNKVLYNQI